MDKENIMEVLLFIVSSTWMPISMNLMIDIRLGKKNRLVCGILQMLAYIVIMSVNYTELSAIIFFPVCLLIVYWGFGKMKLLLIAVPVSYMVVVACSYCMSFILRELEIENLYANKGSFIFTIIGITLMVIFFSFAMRIIAKIYMRHVRGSISKEIRMLLVLNIVLCTIVYLVNAWSFRMMGNPREMGTITRVIFILYALLTVSITLFTLRIVRSQEKIKQEEEERRNLLKYTSQVESMYEELRAFKHDYVNILASLSDYIEKGDMKGLSQYFAQNILPTNEKLNQGKYHLQKLSKIQEPAVKGLVSSKLIYAMNAELDVFVDIVDDVADFAIRTIDLTRILGIYIDNATEAALETEKKEVKLNIVKGQHSITIVLMNSFVDHGLSVGEMEKQHVSTKGENRGLGLNNVNEILRAYPNINKMTEIRDGYFVQTLIIADKAK